MWQITSCSLIGLLIIAVCNFQRFFYGSFVSAFELIFILKLDQTVKCRARSTDRDKLTANKLTSNQRFRHSDLVTDVITVISSISEGLGKTALG